MALDETTFHRQADDFLERLVRILDDAIGDRADIELQSSIATIALADGKSYVINKNAQNQEIWMASPVSGGWHFRWSDDAGAWLSTREPRIALAVLLAQEIERATGTRVEL